MSAPDYVLVNFDDWEALYADGEKLVEGHHVTVRDVIEQTDFCAVTGSTFKFEFVDDTKWQEMGYIPDNLGELDL